MRGQLTIHADRGSPMTEKSTALLYVDLGIAKSHSRPYTSNDNPYSESNFRTLKYRPDMPQQLGSLEHARQVVRELVGWYNDEHYHISLALLHPVDVHYGRTADIVAARQLVLDHAHARHPERFVRGRPRQKTPPAAAWAGVTLASVVSSSRTGALGEIVAATSDISAESPPQLPGRL